MNEDHKDTKTKNAFNEKQEIEKKGSYKHRGFKKASEVKDQPGLQVNIPIGLRSSSEDPNEKKDDTSTTPDKKMKNTETDHSNEDDQ